LIAPCDLGLHLVHRNPIDVVRVARSAAEEAAVGAVGDGRRAVGGGGGGSGVGGLVALGRLDLTEEVTGFDSVVGRDFSDGAISGGSLGPLRLKGRCLTVTGWIRGKTCCATEYGLQWLTEALVQSGGCDNCAYGDLFMLKCCPPDDETCHLGDERNYNTRPVSSQFGIEDVGAGVYNLYIEDLNLANWLSDPNNVDPDNIDGPLIGDCCTYEFSFVDPNGRVWTFLLPTDLIEAGSWGSQSPGGAGYFLIDMTYPMVSCEAPDYLATVQTLQDNIDNWIATWGQSSFPPGVDTIEVTPAGDVTIYEIVQYADPQKYRRLLHRVGLTDGPKVLERHGTCCQNNCGCVNLRVQFTLCSELPYIFSDIEFCAEEEGFNLVDTYCLNLRNLCGSCQTTNPTKTVQREVARVARPISLFSDKRWCPEGWSRSELGCPPEDGFLQIGTIQNIIENTTTVENQDDCEDVGTGDPCLIDLNDDGTWDAVNFQPQFAFPPKHCELQIRNPNRGALGCDGQDLSNCTDGGGTNNMLCDVTLVGAPGPSGTWTSSDFDPEADGFQPNCTINITNGSGCPEPVDEVQELTVEADSGQFKLEFDGDTTAGLDFNSTASEVQTALEGLAGIEPGDVAVSGGPGNDTGDSPYTITFGGNLAATNVPGITGLDFTLMDGVDPGTAAVITVTQGRSGGDSCAVKLVYNVDSGAMTWEGTWPTPGPGCDCYTVASFCIEGGENCLVRVIYDPATGEQSWVPIRWNGDLGSSDECTCFTVAEICVVASTDANCPVETSCPIDVRCGLSFRPRSPLARQAAAAWFYRYNSSPAFVPPGVPTFPDVPLDHPFYLEIEWAVSAGIMEGFSDGDFRPEDPATRQAMAAFFYRQAGSPAFVPPVNPTFSDVDPDDTFYLEIEWMYDQGITTGYNDGTFRPGGNALRETGAIFFYRYDGSPAFADPAAPTFVDVPTDYDWYTEIEWLYSEGITEGFMDDDVYWAPIGWEYDLGDEFPPANCNFVIELVNGLPPETGPITEDIDVPYDEFVPDCNPAFPTPPPAPFILLGQECFCEPWETARVCCTFRNAGDWNDATSYIEIFTGSEEMRHLKIEAYDNPFGLSKPCPCDPADEFWECRTPCASLAAPQLPAGSKLIIDSRLRTASLVLFSGRVVNALRYIYTAEGAPFQWFDIGQCSTLCIVASVDAGNVATDATVSIGMASRYLASGG
jgi:hypothetical protein